MSLSELRFFSKIEDATTDEELDAILAEAKGEGWGEVSSVALRAQSRRETINMKRTLMSGESGLEITHKFGRHDDHGDVTLDADDHLGGFRIWMDQCTGYDRDNYKSYDECEILLNEEEARELHLTLTIWLEGRESS